MYQRLMKTLRTRWERPARQIGPDIVGDTTDRETCLPDHLRARKKCALQCSDMDAHTSTFPARCWQDCSIHPECNRKDGAFRVRVPPSPSQSMTRSIAGSTVVLVSKYEGPGSGVSAMTCDRRPGHARLHMPLSVNLNTPRRPEHAVLKF